MSLKPLKHSLAQISGRLPLRVIFVVPFVLQIFGTVGVVGYLSYRNGRQAVNDLASQLRQELTARIQQQLYGYTEPTHFINQMNADALTRGEIDAIAGEGEILFWHWQKAILFVSNSGTYCGSEEDGSVIGVNASDPHNLRFILSNATTDYRVVEYNLGDRGDRTDIVSRSDRQYDARKRPWYTAAVTAGGPAWSEIYLNFESPLPTITATIPVYDATGDVLLGVCGTDFFLPQEFVMFLQDLEIGRSGQAFIIERSGHLVASSRAELPFVKMGEELERLHASNSKNTLARETTRYLQDHFGNFDRIQNPEQLEFTLNGRREFVQVQPFQDEYGLDWLIVVVIPEADFMGQIRANTRTTILLCVAALVVATGLGILTARWVTQPILRLNQSAKALAKGQWQQTPNIQRQDELGELAKSFNSMAVQLQESFSTLEQRVAERTAELAESNQQLEIAKEKADAANRAKSAFIANMSHELRTPLNAILGFSQILTRSQLLAPEQQENVNIINRSGEYLLTLINNVLNLSKIEAGKTTLNPIDFDLYSLLDEVEQMLYIKAEEKGLQLHFDCADDVPRCIRGDRIKLNQVLINLINNGIKFTREGDIAVHISHQSLVTSHQLSVTNQQPITIHFEIEDTGVGIAPEEIGKIFEAFGQSQSGVTAKEGTGLGLPISRQFVQLMGGDITVKSELNRGTTFEFDIRVTLAESPIISTHSSHRRAIAIASPQPSNYRLLVVDDKPINRQLLLKLLAPFGLSLKEARNGKEAITVWEEWQPHLIWMDLRMPIMDGYEAARIIQTAAVRKNTKIIAITASVLEEEKAVVLAAGFTDFIRKPFRENDIFQALAKHLQIEFVYEEPHRSEESLSPNQISPEALAVLPKTWLRKFQTAIVEGRVKEMEYLIREIPSQNKKLAPILLDLIARYEFEYLLELIQRINNIN
ncbi:MAG: ATP-binding protein [Cyanobacteria bacterium P01_E01_bin.42]